ncbi:MAG TPA: hypothetical protein VG225_16265 [Terracidiphilus sp.]|jgi:hypothetical protein|nr:hypothetical protein [Terracidiphilus sp.]
MAKPKSPHTQSQQNTNFAQTDVNPDDLPQTVGTGADAASYENRDGAQTGGTRSPRHTPGSAHPPRTQGQAVAHEGSLTSRTSRDAGRQGISNRSAQSEAAGQEKVVSQRQDAQAGVNHSGKPPR